MTPLQKMPFSSHTGPLRPRIGVVAGNAAAGAPTHPGFPAGCQSHTHILLAVVTTSLVVGAILGCERAHPFDMDQVSGVVTYDDGSLVPAERIVIRFEPLSDTSNEQIHPKAATSVVDPADGSFGELSTFRYGDGVVRGRHKVLLAATPKIGAGENSKKLIPAEYENMDTSPLEFDTADSPFKILVPKP